MILKTQRLILRPFAEEDAESVYEYARDPDVGPIAGWPPHESVEGSRYTITHFLNGPECYALCLREDPAAIGAIELKLKGATDMTDREDECELGYWLGKPFWGRGLMPEAVREMLRHAFADLGMRAVWCGYYDGNEKSKRVQEKCGFVYHHTCTKVPVPLLGEVRIGHTNLLTRENWEKDRRMRLPQAGRDGLSAGSGSTGSRRMDRGMQMSERPEAYTLTDARYRQEEYRALFGQYCRELAQDDPTMARCDPDALAEENLQSPTDHPYLIQTEGQTAGLVVFMDGESPQDGGCESYLGELFVLPAFRRRGIASRVAADYLAARQGDVGLCYVRHSAAETFWKNRMQSLGYPCRVFREDDVRDFLRIYVQKKEARD